MTRLVWAKISPLLLTAIVLLWLGASVRAQVVSREYAIKAGVLNLLRKFVTWPPAVAPGRNQPVTIGILGPDPFVENGVNQLESVIAAERRKGSLITVQRFATANDYKSCQILFVSSLPDPNDTEQTATDRLEAAKAHTRDEAVLIVGDAPGLARQGATASLVFDRAANLIELEINPDAAARRGLKLAPDLLRLKLVKIVRDGPG